MNLEEQNEAAKEVKHYYIACSPSGYLFFSLIIINYKAKR